MAHISIREPSGDQPEYSAARPKLWDFSHAIVIRMWLWIYPADHSPETTTTTISTGNSQAQAYPSARNWITIVPKAIPRRDLESVQFVCLVVQKPLGSHTPRERGTAAHIETHRIYLHRLS